jgi:iron complex outermembrane receptor protein
VPAGNEAPVTACLSRLWILVTLLVLAGAGPAPRGGSDPFLLTDPEGRPLAGVQVSVVGRPGSALTAPDGSFRLDPLPELPFRLVVFDESGALRGTVIVTSLQGAEARRLVLQPSRVERVKVVTGVSPSTLSSPASAPTLLAREETEDTRPARLADALDEVPGASRSGSGQTAVPALRGLPRGRTLLLLDEARVSTERRAGPSATYLDPFVLERVEVVRGPGSVAYGSDAFGGVLHARTPMPEPGRTRGRAVLAASAGVPYGTAGIEANLPLGQGALLVQGHARRFGDYRSPEGEVENSSAEDAGFLLRGMTPLGSSRLSIGLQVDRARDVERPSTETDRRTVYPEEDSDRLTLALDRASWKGFSSVELRAFLGQYRLVTERESFATASDPRSLAFSEVEAKDASFRLVGNLPAGSGNLRLGLDLSGRFGLNALDGKKEYPDEDTEITVRLEETIASARRLDTGLFAEIDQRLGKGGWSVAAGLRADHVSTRNEGGYFGDRSTGESAPSGYASLRWRFVERWEAVAQVSGGFRDPFLSDRYYRGVTGRGTITGNPELEPETSRQLDLAIRGRAGPLSLAAYGYLYRILDLVERYEVAEEEFSYRNRGEEKVRGLELEAGIEISSTLDARATLGMARGRIVDDDTDAPDIPADTLTLSLRHRPLERIWWRADLFLVARDDRPGPTEVETPGYALLNAAAGWRVSDHLELRLLLGNLLDRRYPDSSDEVAPLAPGRSAALSLTALF